MMATAQTETRQETLQRPHELAPVTLWTDIDALLHELGGTVSEADIVLARQRRSTDEVMADINAVLAITLDLTEHPQVARPEVTTLDTNEALLLANVWQECGLGHDHVVLAVRRHNGGIDSWTPDGRQRINHPGMVMSITIGHTNSVGDFYAYELSPILQRFENGAEGPFSAMTATLAGRRAIEKASWPEIVGSENWIG